MATLRRGMPDWTRHWLRDTGVLVTSQVFVVVMTAATAIILVRSLGPSDWGLFSALLGLNAALSIFVTLGLGTWLLRDLSQLQAAEPSLERRRRESSRRVVGGVLASVGFGALLFIVSAIVVASIGLPATTATAFLALTVSTMLGAASSCLEAYFRAERKVTRILSADIIERGLLLALIVIGAILQVSIALFALAHLLASFIRLSFVSIIIFVRQKLPVVMPALGEIRQFVLNGVPFAFNRVALNVIPRLDPFLIALVSVAAAGYFALGDRIIGPALIIPVVASTALYPFLARDDSRTNAMWKITGGSMLLGIAVAIIGAVAAPYVVPALFGSDYVDAVIVVQLMLVVLPFIYGSNPLLAYLYTNNRERHVFAVTIVGSVVGTVAVVVGALTFGAIGAAGGYVLRQIVFTATLAAIALSLRKRKAVGSAHTAAGLGPRDSAHRE